MREEEQQKQQDNELALVYIQLRHGSVESLWRAVQRMSRNVRESDHVLYEGHQCAIVLPCTSLRGGQAVAKRLTGLLAGMEYECQVLYGASAQARLHKLLADHAREVQKDEPVELYRSQIVVEEQQRTLPYLAFLADYPAPGLLRLFPYELACRYHCVPVGGERGALTLATVESLHPSVLEQIRAVVQRNIFQVRCETHIIEDVLRYWRTVAPVPVYI